MDGQVEFWQTCCGQCGMGLCYVDQLNGAADEGHGWQH